MLSSVIIPSPPINTEIGGKEASEGYEGGDGVQLAEVLVLLLPMLDPMPLEELLLMLWRWPVNVHVKERKRSGNVKQLKLLTKRKSMHKKLRQCTTQNNHKRRT